MKCTGRAGQGCRKHNVKKRRLPAFISPLAIAFLLLTFLPGPVIPGSVSQAFAALYINEFMADNDSVYQDPAGGFDDWIEIYNSGTAAVSMAGMYLTDDLADPTKWRIPAGVTIPKKGYLIFWADNQEEQGSYHTSFALSAAGEEIGLFGTDGTTLVDSVTFGAQLLDVSYGRYPDGTGTWGFMAGTPGAANSVHNAPPAITGTTRDPVLPAAGAQIWMTCTVTDDGTGEIVVMLAYNAGSGWVNVRMQDDGENHDGESNDDLFGAPIPAFPQNTTVRYYITATDDLDAQSADPVTAPAATYYYIVGYVPPVLFINEFMADNKNTIPDPDDPNSYPDWIEIYNPGNAAVTIAGMYLTDNLVNPTQWRIPAGVTIPAKGYLIFWADNDVDQGDYHTSFALAAEGEEIGLFGADGVTLVDSVIFGAQLMDVSYGRYPDGSGSWGFMAPATPEHENNQHNPPPAISGTTHTPALPTMVDPVWVTCTVIDDTAGVFVMLTSNVGSATYDVQMRDDGAHHDGGSNDGIFGAKISDFSSNGIIVDYYITATDASGAVTTDPLRAPSVTYFYIVGYVTPPLFINEFMADNKGTIQDPQDPNSFPDWIEIYNAGDADISMAGMYLSDDCDDPAKWHIPAGVTIPAGGHLIFWADNDEEQGVYHAGFRINRDGGEIGLFDTGAKRYMPIDTMTFGKQPADNSWGRIYDAEGPLVLSQNPTPGYANVFPLGTHPMIWTFSQRMDSHALIKAMGNCVSAIERADPASGKRESAYPFWGRPSGRQFSIEPGEGHIISFTTPCLSPFE